MLHILKCTFKYSSDWVYPLPYVMNIADSYVIEHLSHMFSPPGMGLEILMCLLGTVVYRFQICCHESIVARSYHLKSA